MSYDMDEYERTFQSPSLPNQTITTPYSLSISSSPPVTRGSSPSPTISPTPALLACPSLDRSFSASSYNSSFSLSTRSSDFSARSSTGSTISTVSASARRRGYVRPQGVPFAESARNRDSVMNLGSIAHLQYYFARTGMLEGKGGQLARARKDGPGYDISMTRIRDQEKPEIEISGEHGEDDDPDSWEDSMMLPPTVSTYNHHEPYVEPVKTAEELRQDVGEALGHMKHALEDVKRQQEEALDSKLDTLAISHLEGEDAGTPSFMPESPSRKWHEIQGMHILDVVTLTIKAAKDYYTMHEHPQRLSKIKSERKIREELLDVLDALKRMAIRNFAGGVKVQEFIVMEMWTRSVESLLAKELEMEAQERRDMESWVWLQGDWTANPRQREYQFLKTFTDTEDLPAWTELPENAMEPSPFLLALQSGLTLVHLHNRILKKTKRHFGEITNFHSDTAKPYRAADNLRYWIKAAELRWEIKLNVDVMALVYFKPEAWKGFEDAIMTWCLSVRQEITKEWKKGSVEVPAPVLGA